MTFTNGTQTEKHNSTLNSQTIENVKEYKYLGTTINSKNCSFVPTLADLGCKGKRALYAITSKIPLKLVPIKTMLKLFDACITPILLYGSEIWGAYTNIDHNKWESTPIEKIHTQLLKRILGVNRSTTNIVRGEMGRHSLQAYILNRNKNYIKYVENKCNTTLVKQALNYEQSKMECRPTVPCLLQNHENGLRTHLKNEEEIKHVNKLLRKRRVCEAKFRYKKIVAIEA